MNSLSARVSLTAAVVVALFIALTALALDRAFQQRAEAAVAERLTAQLYLLMADAEVGPHGRLRMAQRLTEPRLALPGSGLYAEIHRRRAEPLWRSPSAVGVDLALPKAVKLEDGFHRLPIGGQPFFVRSLAIEWESNGHSHPLRFTLYEDLHGFNTELTQYRHSLWRWLGAMGLLLLLAQAAALAWGLRPLRAAAGEIERIERGEQQQIEGDYPKELDRLTRNINTLLRHERAQQGRYRDALADLAHSLKTPLAVLRGLKPGDGSESLQAQLQRMDEIVGYQLQRASTAGRSALAAPVAVAPIVERLLVSLEKVYRDKGVAVERQLDAAARLRGDEGDLLELLGNLLDNGFKWCGGRLRISAGCSSDQLLLTVEDDGPGIPAALSEQLLHRGTRLDEATPGHGIGLAMVSDIVNAYEGRLTFMQSELGGARIEVRLPGCEEGAG